MDTDRTHRRLARVARRNGQRKAARSLLRRWGRNTLWGVVVSALVFGLANPTTLSQEIPQMVEPVDFGFGGMGPLGMMTGGDAWALMSSNMDLSAIDPHTGAVLSDAANPIGSMDYAAQIALMEADQMAIDAQRLAEEVARRREEKKKLAAGSGIAVDRMTGVGYPKEWELDRFSTCGAKSNAQYQARIEVVAAWEIMCKAAEADGVPLRIVSAYRSVEHQTRLWNQKLKETGGNAALARKWVAPPGKSNHNRGLAIDLAIMTGDPKAKAWVHKVVGCYSPSTQKVEMGRTSCSGDLRAVKQVQLYGFILPMDWEPWHIELGVRIYPEGTNAGSDCNPSTAMAIPEMVAAIWRCRLDEAGFSAAEREKVVQEALVISKCESSWNPEAIAFGGRYLNTPHPKTGKTYSARGVFQFIKASANTWVEGGWENANDPAANINGAVSYYLAERKAGREGWGPWECNFSLPQYGGPKIPDWAKQY